MKDSHLNLSDGMCKHCTLVMYVQHAFFEPARVFIMAQCHAQVAQDVWIVT